MVEAGFAELLEPLALEQHGGGDEVGIKPGLRRGLDDVLEVAARRRLAAGEMDLQDAELAGLRMTLCHSSVDSSVLTRSSSSGLEQ